MGITSLSLYRINRHLKPNSKLLIIGCQNLYNAENYMEIAHPYFEKLGHIVKSIDILGCNGSDIADLRDDLKFNSEYDQVWNHGSSEHVDGSLWQVFKNIHEACIDGGVMIHENPKTGSWPGHGYHYMTSDFYGKLSNLCKYHLVEITSEPAMGNTVDGWNISAVLKKSHKSKFITEQEFDKLYNETVFKS